MPLALDQVAGRANHFDASAVGSAACDGELGTLDVRAEGAVPHVRAFTGVAFLGTEPVDA